MFKFLRCAHREVNRDGTRTTLSYLLTESDEIEARAVSWVISPAPLPIAMIATSGGRSAPA